MTKLNRKHTHRGTCQACGRAQAFTAAGVVAKHGYTVDWGFFNGVCQGADAKPLEHDKTLTESLIKILREIEAVRADKLAADLTSGAVEPEFYNSSYDRIKCKTVRTACKREELKFEYYETQDDVAKRQIKAAIMNAESSARHARSHANMLVQLIDKRHGQPLIAVSNKKELTVGTRVLIGGAKGRIYEVVEIRVQRCSGCGPYLNGQHLPHAIFARKDGDGTWATPVRSIRQSAILEGDCIV